MIRRGRVTAPGHTLLERGTRLINTTPKESRWREARRKPLPPEPDQIGHQHSSAESSAPKSPLTTIFGHGEEGKGRLKPRFTRNPQPDVTSKTVEKQGVELAPRSALSSAVVRPAPGGQAVRNGVKLQRCPSSGLLAGYEMNEEVDTAEARVVPVVALEWAVKTCPVCHGTATLVCDTCNSDWPLGACPDCKGRGYKACSYCDGSGTTYGQSKHSTSRAQPTKPLSAKGPTRDLADGATEEGPSLLEAYRILSNERQMRSPTSRSNGAAQWLVGKPKSEEHRTKISRALQGKPRSPLSPSHKKKLSKLRREFFQEPGAKERWSEEAKQLWAPRKRIMHCSHCGLEGHNSRFCPEQGFVKSTNKPCLICGQPGHFWGSCPRRSSVKVPFRCKKCGEYGHDAGQCPNSSPFPGRVLCEICGLPGHRIRECPERPRELIIQRCSICGQPGHNKKRCPQRSPESS